MERSTRVLSFLLLGCVAAVAGLGGRAEPADAMAGAAGAFLESLTPELRAKAALGFEDRAREDWHYVPRQGAGVEFSEMSSVQKQRARELLRAALSSRGMGKVEEIMLLDAVLREMEKGSGRRRDPLAYSVAVFGTPGRGPWGWKLEGHHISLNFTGVEKGVAVTPGFLGANPAEVREGDRAGVRVLAAEEDIARELLASLTPEQKRGAIVGTVAPSDLLGVPGRSRAEVDASGLAVSAMSESQRRMVVQLIREYAENLRHELAAAEWRRIEDAGVERIRFAWMGGESRGEGHYYRLSGPTFVIEYDNTQNNANHVHTVWRDRERDFGRDLLREHHEHDHEKK